MSRRFYLGAEQSRTSNAQAELASGTYMAVGEKLDWSYYDTQILQVANLSHTYMTQGVGKPFTTGAIKTIADSNILSENLPEGLKFTIKAIKIFYLSAITKTSAALLEWFQLMHQGVLTFKIANKDAIWQTTLAEAISLNTAIIHHPAVAGDNDTNGQMNIIRSAYPINVDIVIAARTNWKILLEHTVAPGATVANDRLKISCQGILERLS